MNILILGTSNSLLRTGWVAGLKVNFPEAKVDNWSIGASPGIQYVSKMNIDFTHYDYVFFDSLPNDEEYYDWDLCKQDKNSIDFFFKNIEEIINTIKSQTNIILVMIPIKKFFYKKSSIYDHRKQYAEKNGVPYIDVAEIIHFLISKNKIKFDDIYKYHEAHPEVSIMNFLGREIANYIKNKSISNKKIQTNYIRKNVFNNVIENCIFNGVHYKNSIIDEVFYDIKYKNTISIPDNKFYVGMYVNIRNTNCLLRFMDKEDKEIYNISLYYQCENNQSSILKVFVPCPKKIEASYILVDSPESSLSPYWGMGSSREPISQDFVYLTASEIIVSDHEFQTKIPNKDHEYTKITNDLISILDKIDEISFFITPKHGCDTIQKTIVYLEHNVMSEDKTISIMTHDENVLCMDLNSFELCHIKTYEYINNNHLKLIQIEIIDVNALHMFVEVSGMRIYARPFGGREIKFIFSGMHISFECDERYLCAEHDGTVTTDRKK